MSLFNLTDIKITSAKGPTGPLSVLGQSKYETNTFRYPEDLSASDKGHYMIININEQRHTSYKDPNATLASGDSPTAISSAQSQGSFFAGTQNLLRTVGSGIREAGSFGSYVANQLLGVRGVNDLFNALKSNPVGSALGGAGSESLSIISDVGKRLQTGSIRAEKRITDTIALYMPDTLLFDSVQYYNSIEAGGTGLAAAAALTGSTVDLYRATGGINEAFGKQFMRNASPFMASIIANATGGLGKVAFSQAFGVVQNPMLELLYSKPDFRSFRFDFMFHPRSQKESKEVQKIIERLRFHQAPEVAQGGTGGFFMVPPSEFDISFYYEGAVNPNIPKISTCVLTNMNVDYAPNGFTAYEVPGQPATLGGTGMPVAIRLSLSFKETEIMTKTSFAGTAGRKLTSTLAPSDGLYKNLDFQ
ncbi:MAG: hypothetical protein FJY17_00545 [Bacteroidetes bacterium]|nr:hypothetical protein [Bacteroidota bacterium]